jgi:GNAT superfamily N-acetyltransferase
MARAWPSFKAIDYDGWILRFADGYTKRANSVNPHFGSSLPLATKIAHCESAYRERGLPTIFRLTPFSQPEDLDDTLATRGYEMLDPTLVMTCSHHGVLEDKVEPVSVVPADQWFAAFDRLRKLEAFERACHRRIIESSEGQRCFAAVIDDGKPMACGLGVLVDDAVGLFDLFTRESHRGQGLGSSIVRLILEWASNRGAGNGFLQVHSLNAPARRLYERFGFEVAYPYWYRIKA